MGTPIGKVHFEVLGIDPKVKFSQFIRVEGNYQYDFNFKDLEEAQGFYIALVKEAIELGTFNTKAITGIGNDILRQF